MVITLAGIARFVVVRDIAGEEPFRIVRVDFAPYAKDFVGGYGEDDVDRPRLIATLRSYLIANNLNADWERINSASNERLVNTLSILSPYGPEEKQALLEAPRLAGARRGAGGARRDGACGDRRRLGDIAAMTDQETQDDATHPSAAASGGSIRSCSRSWSVR